ncbi:MAG TPA: esterase-like activity of phytase family protein [Vicinamibacterales bacterium]|nr:esterase-like activity of phytase family protein [Vicinamibacterales bacterium]
MKTLSAVVTLATAIAASSSAGAQTLEGFARFPADTFAPGPTSGQLIAPANGRVPPFVDKQPVQGFSSVLRASNGDFLAMPDNGFGTKETSPDFVLRLYRIAPDFRTKTGGSGAIAITSFITLSDPDRRITFPIVADLQLYPGTAIPVDANLKSHRWLTGADFDIESVREAHDGTLWFGDEFGPFLLHTDATGRLLDAPYPLAGVRSPQNPFLGGAPPTLPRSKGFEGMAITPNGKTLYPMLEGPLIADPDQHRLIINQFDLGTRSYTGRQWFYRLEASSATGQSIGDLTAVTDRLFLVIERDNFEGAAAAFKKIFLIDLDDVDAAGFVAKREVADLLHIADPDNLGGFGPVFRFPFQTIEAVIPLSNITLGVLNDNNYPFSSGRVPGSPDPDEFIVIKLDRPLVGR